jgi:hypothetical protein
LKNLKKIILFLFKKLFKKFFFYFCYFFQEFLTEKGFTLVDKQNDIHLELVKKVGDKNISILFSSRAPP